MAPAKSTAGPTQPPSPPPPFFAAISTVATAQICRAAGYTAAEPSALRALADIAGRYILSLAGAAAASANSCGRTETNLLDLTRALEEHAAADGGFAGGSEPAPPLLRSGVLKELVGFVAAVREVPFAKPIPRRKGLGSPAASFAAAGREPPLRHVPRWLPCFPDTWKGWERGGQKEDEEETADAAPNGGFNYNEEKREETRRELVMAEKRRKVKFEIIVAKKKKKKTRLESDNCGIKFLD